jgi:hypothetical protein
MNNKFLQLVILALAAWPLAAQACPTSNDPNSTFKYIRRDGDRCEGLIDPPASNSSDLVSLSSGFSQLNGYPNILNIRIPSSGSIYPTIEIQSNQRNYRLDKLIAKPSAKGFIFGLNTRILNQKNISPSSLQARAFTLGNGSTQVFIPVILDRPTGQYEFIVKSNRRVTFPTFEIRRNYKLVFRRPSQLPDYTHKLIWKYSSADQQGIYQLRIQDDGGTFRSYTFEHNPNLL